MSYAPLLSFSDKPMSEFLHDASFYIRDSKYVNNYVRQMATGLAIEFGISIDEAISDIQRWKAEGRFVGCETPKISYFTKDRNDDRIHGESTLTEYLDTCVKNKHILVPTFTAYLASEVRRSPLSAYIVDNVSKRAKAKKISQKARAENDFALFFLKDVEQKNKKENNNSMSGLFSAESSIFFNDTGHNTLTSITRSMASVANALNERIIGGNRHYRDLNSAINNTLAIIESTDMKEVRSVLDEYGLRGPTKEELMSVYRRSMRYYTFDHTVYAKLKPLIEGMTEEQRAAVAYSQDLYHVKKFNRGAVHELLTEFSKAEITQHYEDPAAFIHKQDELTVSFAHQVCLEEMRGRGKDYNGKYKADHPDVKAGKVQAGDRRVPEETVQLVANVCANINKNIARYKNFFKVFFLTRTVPNNTAFIQDMVRTTVVLSDTDSTMFSVDQWVMDYFGKLDFTSRGFAVAGTIAFISSQVNAHCLAVLSGNMGVSADLIFKLSMKPEFVFPVFIQSPVAKHYFTAKLVCEGDVYAELDMEIKGVHNRNSAIPDSVNDTSHTRMRATIERIMSGRKLSMREEIASMCEQERNILTSLQLGSPEFYKRTSIKTPNSYSVEDPIKNSIYAFHTLWMQVYAKKYGALPEPNYDVVKVPTKLKTKTKFNQWLNSWHDQEMANHFRAWMIDHKKTTLKTMYFSVDFLEGNGLPEEVLGIVDYDKIVLDLTMTRRLMLDSFGLTPRPDYLVSSYGVEPNNSRDLNEEAEVTA